MRSATAGFLLQNSASYWGTVVARRPQSLGRAQRYDPTRQGCDRQGETFGQDVLPINARLRWIG